MLENKEREGSSSSSTVTIERGRLDPWTDSVNATVPHSASLDERSAIDGFQKHTSSHGKLPEGLQYLLRTKNIL